MVLNTPWIWYCITGFYKRVSILYSVGLPFECAFIRFRQTSLWGMMMYIKYSWDCLLGLNQRATLHEKCSNTEFFLVSIFLYSVPIEEKTPYLDTFYAVLLWGRLGHEGFRSMLYETLTYLHIEITQLLTQKFRKTSPRIIRKVLLTC